MPTYEYECKACGHRFDELQKFSDPVLTKCPACKKNKLDRLFGGGGAIIFKGSGFYETDYRRPPEKGDSKPADAGSGGDSKPADAPKAEAKPAADTSSGSSASGGSKGGGKGGSKKAT